MSKGKKALENDLRKAKSDYLSIQGKLYRSNMKVIKLEGELAKLNTYTWFDFIKIGVKKLFKR